MQYFGGKFRTRKQLAAFLHGLNRLKPTKYFEPFVGGAWVLQEVKAISRTASDGNKSLITLYKHLQNGWIPPENISEEDYSYYKMHKDPTDPMTAFVGFGCSFGGKWFDGYAKGRPEQPNYAASAKRTLLKQLPLIKDVEFVDGLFHEHNPTGCLIYCDPPYQGTTNYGAFSGFNHNLFWQTMRSWSENNTVVISEYAAPDDFVCVKEMSSLMGMSSDIKGLRLNRIEKLFMLRQ